RKVRTGKVLKAKQEVHGDSLYFASRTTHLIRHPCKERVVAYLGRQVFLSTDNFESSLPPLTIPTAMQVGVPQVTSAYFSEAGLLLVINQNVYLYSLDTGTWRASKGIEHPVSHISGGTCCYMGNSFCTAAFAYSDPPLSSSFGVPFAYNESLEVHLPPGHRGILILWSERTLQVSHNTGQLVSPIMVQQGEKTVRPSIFGAGITIHSIATSASPTRQTPPRWRPTASPHTAPAGTVPRIELLEGEFQGQIFTIDMNSELRLSAQVVPRPGATLIPMVKVSNPHALGLQANFYDFGTTWQGNAKYKLDIHLKQQYHWGRSDINFLSSIKQSTISSLTVDIANKEMSCIDIKPLNYMSCHEPNKNNPLQWPEAEYQILGGPTENKIIFEQRNGIYVFLISVVDPYYR
ncbi:Transmembrane protein 146, partial [Tupaia chinensis]